MLAALLLALFAGKARGTELPFGAATDYYSLVAHVDDSFHDVLTNDGDEWVKAIRVVHGFCADDASAEVTVCPDMSCTADATIARLGAGVHERHAVECVRPRRRPPSARPRRRSPPPPSLFCYSRPRSHPMMSDPPMP